jgi:MFS transporter, DHA1 family, multidrug resistance protein
MFKSGRLAILFFTMVVMMLGFGIVIPIIPFILQEVTGKETVGSEMGLLMAIFSIGQFIFSPFWGSLSDRYGRKKILMFGVFGSAISMVTFGLSTNLTMLFLSRALAGVLSSATLPTTMAYISDSTSERDRNGGMGIIGAAMGMGMVLGPGVGGWLGGQSLSAPFFLAAGLSMVAMILIWLLLPESLPVERRVKTAGKFAGPQLGEMWKALFGPMGFLLFLAFLVNFGLASFEGIFGLYTISRFKYTPEQVGTIMVVVGVVSTAVQGMLTGPVTRWIGEVAVIKLSLIGSALGFILMVMVFNDIWIVSLAVGFFVFSTAMLRPSIFSLASKKAQGGQGMALGLNNSFQSLGRVIGPLWAGFLFDYGINLPYLTGALIMLATFGMSLVWLARESGPRQDSLAREASGD